MEIRKDLMVSGISFRAKKRMKIITRPHSELKVKVTPEIRKSSVISSCGVLILILAGNNQRFQTNQTNTLHLIFIIVGEIFVQILKRNFYTKNNSIQFAHI